MPTLHWIGKDKVINHHRDVPYKVLEKQYTFTAEGGVVPTGEGKGKNSKVERGGFEPPVHASGGGNKIIHGDNLEALKSLLPEYEGKVKCIYIDPPYNTGNEGWVYNDNVNDPRIKKWLGDVVGKEGEDLSRHDKWLCMMYPRLVLLHKLLAEDGALFVSIDDSEHSHLQLVLTEIFGQGNFVANIVWQKKYGPANDAKYLSETHEYITVWARSKDNWRPNLIPRDEDQLSAYRNTDNDPRGLWRASDLSARTYSANCDYTITSPFTGRQFTPPKSRSWIVTKERFQELLEDKRIAFGADGNGRPMQKKFLSEVRQGITPQTWWDRDFAGDNKVARYELKDIFPENPFDTPKPSSLLERLLQVGTSIDSIILDSFAGSGTTAHAVLNLNKQDGGKRKFILIEMMDYAETITAERVKRVMQGFGEGNKKTEGTGGAFDYYILGQPLFNAQHNLNEEVGTEKIREYIWYSETRTALAGIPGQARNDAGYYLGTHERTAYYFVYEKESLTTVDHELLATLPTKGERTVIYADNCLLPKKFMEQHGIVFKKIPRDITRF